jgi:hypothetical protein
MNTGCSFLIRWLDIAGEGVKYQLLVMAKAGLPRYEPATPYAIVRCHA